MSIKVKVFDYVAELDCFVVRPEFKALMRRLWLVEWTPVVWICRLFCLDNDWGEHLFDNWAERTRLADRARELGYEQKELMIVVPDRLHSRKVACYRCKSDVVYALCPECKERTLWVGPNGPSHPEDVRKRFWTDILDGMTLSLSTIFAEAAHNLDSHKDDRLQTFNLSDEIRQIKEEYGVTE